jgi:carboxylesterase type B
VEEDAMTHRIAIPLILPVLLAACQQSTAPANQSAAAPVMSPADFDKQIAALSESARDAVFLRAVTDAQFDCQIVEKTTAHAPISGRPAWVVECDHDNNYVALLDPGQVIQVVRGVPEDQGN